MTDSLRKNLSLLDSDELRHKIDNSILTEQAHEVAIGILADRGEDVSSLQQAPSNPILARTYGTASEEEQEISNRSFLNLGILFVLPLTIIVIFGTAIYIGDQWNSIASLVLYLICTIANYLLLRASYRSLFKRQDKLATGSKAYFFIPAVLTFCLMSVLLIAGSLLKLFR